MKKSLLVALVGILFFALTSCGDSTKSNGESKEFSEAKAFIQKYDKAFQEAQTCDELEALVEKMEGDAMALDSDNFAEEDRMTDAEETELQKLAMTWLETISKKVDELGCEEGEEVEVEEVVVEEE